MRATQSFFEELDVQLGDERGPDGEPNSHDFQSHELFAIVERFAVDWDRLPELLAGRSDYRVLIGSGTGDGCARIRGHWPAWADGAIELTGIATLTDGSTSLTSKRTYVLRTP